MAPDSINKRKIPMNVPTAAAAAAAARIKQYIVLSTSDLNMKNILFMFAGKMSFIYVIASIL